jgi:hypothetical protein
MKAYIYQAALLCEDCADIVQEVRKGKGGFDDYPENSDIWPQGPYSDGGGESDCPEHCDHCGLFLENPLTSDGEAYVKEFVASHQLGKTANPLPCAREWRERYAYLFTEDAG